MSNLSNNQNQGLNLKAVFFIGLLTAVFAGLILLFDDHDHEHANGHKHGDAEQEEEIPKGPHRGRMLTKDDFSLEITIYETGLPPEFRVYAYHYARPLQPQDVKLTIELARTGNKTDLIKFKPETDYLRGDTEIYEPHSFEVFVTAEYKGKSYKWRYNNFEGRTQINNAMAEELGIKTEKVGPTVLTETVTLNGRVITNPNMYSRILPRFPGVIKKIHRELGDKVKKGDPLVTIQSNESLQNYLVRSPIDGDIVGRNARTGEATGQQPLFVIANQSEVWVELDVFSRDMASIRAGQPVVIETLEGTSRKQANIDWVSPIASNESQSIKVRVNVANEDGLFRSGQFVRGHVTVAEHQVPLAVRQSAIQGFRDFKVVFARFDETYEVRMLELGRQNREWVEVLGGIEPGTEYVSDNSYLIKADIEKSGASHDH